MMVKTKKRHKIKKKKKIIIFVLVRSIREKIRTIKRIAKKNTHKQQKNWQRNRDMFHFFGSSSAGPRGFAGRQQCDTASDLYSLLDVSRDATAQQIKKAYHKKALELHPDKGGDEQSFRKVQEAFEVLSSANRRQLYDRFGIVDKNGSASRGWAGGGGVGGFTTARSFFFRAAAGNGSGATWGTRTTRQAGGGGKRSHEEKKRKARFGLTLSLQEMYAGCTKTVNLAHSGQCPECTATSSGAKERQKTLLPCEACEGKGRKVTVVPTSPGRFQTNVVLCANCNGRGRVFSQTAPGGEGGKDVPQPECGRCAGKGSVQTGFSVKVDVPRGACAGEEIVVPNRAGEVSKLIDGDLAFVVKEKKQALRARNESRSSSNNTQKPGPNPNYFRVESLLCVEKEIGLDQALFPCTVSLPHPDGSRTLAVSLPQVVQPNTVIRIPGRGMPTKPNKKHHLSETEFGDLFVKFKVVLPEDLKQPSEETACREALRKAFFDGDADPKQPDDPPQGPDDGWDTCDHVPATWEELEEAVSREQSGHRNDDDRGDASSSGTRCRTQ